MKSSNDLTRNGLLDQLCDSLDERFTAGQSNFLFVLVRPGESHRAAQERAFNEACCRQAPRYMLLIDIGPPPAVGAQESEQEMDKEIARTIKELKEAGVSDDEIRQALQA